MSPKSTTILYKTHLYSLVFGDVPSFTCAYPYPVENATSNNTTISFLMNNIFSICKITIFFNNRKQVLVLPDWKT